MQQAWQQEEKPYDRLLAFLNSHQPEEGMTPEQVRRQRERRYQEVRSRVIKLFAWRGASIPEDLAEETFARVTKKLGELQDYKGDPAHYVAGFVRIIYLESLRQTSNQESLSEKPDPKTTPSEEEPVDAEHRDACVQKCLQRLPDPEDRQLILEYYQDDKRARIDHRAEIARRYNLTVNGLRIRCCRIRRFLRPCLQECLERTS